MRRFRLSTFLLLMLIVSLGIDLVVLQRRPSLRAVRQEIKRLEFMQANLRRAGVLTPKKDKMLSGQLATLKEWDR